MIANNRKLAENTAASVTTDDTGSSPRRKSMLRMIERRMLTAFMPLITASGHELERHHRARDREPGALAGLVEHERDEHEVDADDRERVEQPLEEGQPTAPVARTQVRDRQREEDVVQPRGRSGQTFGVRRRDAGGALVLAGGDLAR